MGNLTSKIERVEASDGKAVATANEAEERESCPVSPVYEVADDSDYQEVTDGLADKSLIVTAVIQEHNERVNDSDFAAVAITGDSDTSNFENTAPPTAAGSAETEDIPFEATLDYKLREAGLLKQFIDDKGRKVGNTAYRRVLKFYDYSGGSLS
jgi:hypothetical protein